MERTKRYTLEVSVKNEYNAIVRWHVKQYLFHFSKDLLKSLNHAKNVIDITEDQIEISLKSKKSILTDNKSTWSKNITDNL